MVCRDSSTQKARNISPLLLDTPEENALNAIGEAYRARRQSLALRSLTRVPPTVEEVEKLHSLHLHYGHGGSAVLQPGEERVWMGDTKVEVSQIMFPQDRK